MSDTEELSEMFTVIGVEDKVREKNIKIRKKYSKRCLDNVCVYCGRDRPTSLEQACSDCLRQHFDADIYGMYMVYEGNKYYECDIIE